jgi:enamine deaminase RidA (YjgF/YER057c/UK114 family)
MPEKEFLNPSELPDWSQHFTQVITVQQGASKTAYVSGQVGVDENKNLVGDGSLTAQAMQAFKNLEKALAAAGATTADVVKVNIYVKNYQAENAAEVTEAYRQCFPFQHLPTSTWIGVQSLAREEFLIEVDAIAVFE